MIVQQKKWENGAWEHFAGPEEGLKDATFVLFFGGSEQLKRSTLMEEIRGFYPSAQIVGCSTGGEILGADVYDNTVSLTAVKFEKTPIKLSSCSIQSLEDSFSTGEALAKDLKQEDLRHIFVLSDGLNVNGTALVEGMKGVVGENISLTGGLAGDGAAFEKTLIYDNQTLDEKQIVAVGFYGDHFQVGHCSLGGWHPFGPERTITKAKGSVLYELDDQPALELYKTYLGEDAKNLPSSGLLFPLHVRPPEEADRFVTRTILGVDEATQSMTFAGEIKEGYLAQLMSANFDLMVSKSGEAAQKSLDMIQKKDQTGLAILISCIGRKLVLGPRISDETDEADHVLGEHILKAGFYSYGEICPHHITQTCELHNQTMTISVFSEK